MRCTMTARLALVLAVLAGCTITPADAAPTQTAPVSGLPAAAVATQPAAPVAPRTTLPAPTTTVAPTYTHPDPNVERWHALALAVGWPEAEWEWLSCVVARESRGDPNAYNGRGPDASVGLAQLNTKGYLWGWFVALGLTDRAQLFDPTTNLYAARAMFLQFGRKPWRTDRGSCE